MKRLLIPLMAASVAIGGAAPVLASDAQTNYFAIIIDGKTKNIELWVTLLRERAEELSKTMHAPSGAFSSDGVGGRIIGRGNCTLPPNSSIGAFRNTSLDFVAGILFEYESSRKRNSKLVTKTDELRKDGTYTAVIEQTTLGYHH